MKNTEKHTKPLAQNLTALRQIHQYSQEEVAEKIGVSRQAVAKWETGETAPDLMNSDALAALYGVTLDDLIHFDPHDRGIPIPPKGKHLFGTVKVGERGQIVLPKKARELFGLRSGDLLVVLGSEQPGEAGIALVREEELLQTLGFLQAALSQEADEEVDPE